MVLCDMRAVSPVGVKSIGPSFFRRINYNNIFWRNFKPLVVAAISSEQAYYNTEYTYLLKTISINIIYIILMGKSLR